MKNEIDEVIGSFVNKRLSDKIKEVLTTNKNAIILDFNDVDQFSPELGDYLLKNPEEALDTIKYFINETSIPHKDLDIEVRIKNLPKNAQLLIREIRSKHIGLFIQVQGLIKTAASVKPVASAIDFECQSCGHITKVEQKEMTQRAPSVCTNCGKKGRFKVVKKYLVDTQRIMLEEAPEDLEGGEQPEHINVVLKKDLVDPKFERNIIPGNKVVVSGIINESAIYYPSGKRSNTSDTFILASYVEAVEQGYEDIVVTKEEEMAIKELANDKMIYTKFKNSIAPNIFGHDDIKEAIVMQLFGGVRKAALSGNSVIRGDIHILLVGDPGTSKSSLLKYVTGIAPKARYVVGMGSSAAGLTATIIKDEATRSYILEAGALPLTNKGLLMIDELDKMNKDDRVAMHEALEQQSISISKANIHATLTAQTSVLAAANPKLGRFNPFDVISSQIELPPTLINRFDLIFILKDRPDKETDTLIAQRILEANRDINKNKPEIPPNIMKKYIAYAKQNIKPKISVDAMKVIQDFYLKLRSQYSTEGEEVKPIPISARQLEAVVRLTEASAKVRLSEYATVEDAKRAIDLMMAYLGDVGIDSSTGQLDIDRITTGISSSQRNTVLTVKSMIKSEIDSMPMGSSVPISKIYEDAEKAGIDQDKVDSAISVLKREGEIFEPKPSFIKLL
ncbi:MAG: minichromosome maintenance protein MCM [Candidatus Parvarchaeum sp.]